jgi:hypothetical protein
MKRVIAITVISILVLALTACGASAGSLQPASSSSGSSASNGNSSSSSNSAPVNGTPTTGLSALQLAAGMLKLAGTSNAVTSQEAKQLLPLWQSLQQMESAIVPQGGFQQGRPQGTPGAPQPNPTMTAMRQQVAAQITAIENAMPPAQIQAIAAMNLTGQDIFTTFQQAGITMGGPGQGGGFRSNNGGTFTPPQGAPPVSGTPRAFRGGFGQGGRMGMGDFLPSSVVTGMIQFLQKTAGS